tara:strand:- start:3589 stop:3852 length:264 start_codon:yes stop_codon:yes gene_type:complete
MAKRYEKTTIKINEKTNKQVYSTTLYKEIPKKDSDMYFIAQNGDRLDTLAQRFYKNASLWWYIARANNLKTMNVPAGTSLRIPTLIT